MAVLVGVKGPLKVALQFLLQNNGMMVQTCQWSSNHLQKQVNQLIDKWGSGRFFFFFLSLILMHSLLFVPAGGSAALFQDGHPFKHLRHTLIFLSFFQIMDSDVVVFSEMGHKGLPPTWLRPGVAVINLGSALIEGKFLQSKAVLLGRHFYIAGICKTYRALLSLKNVI